MRAVRAALSTAARRDGNLAVIDACFPLSEGAVVSGYIAIGDELDPAPLMQHLQAQHGCRLCLPVMLGRDQPLTFRAFQPGDSLDIKQWGIREPQPHQAVLEPNVLLVPLLAVDRAGYRLGYGGGYYDRTLRDLRARKVIIACGLAYDAQIIDAVPRLDYDEPLDALLTPSGLTRFAGR